MSRARKWVSIFGVVAIQPVIYVLLLGPYFWLLNHSIILPYVGRRRTFAYHLLLWAIVPVDGLVEAVPFLKPPIHAYFKWWGMF